MILVLEVLLKSKLLLMISELFCGPYAECSWIQVGVEKMQKLQLICLVDVTLNRTGS